VIRSYSPRSGARLVRWAPPFLVLVLLLCSAAASSAVDIPVRVDPRVELMSIIFRLAGSPEYNQGQVTAYEADIDAFFADVRDHPAVVLARKLHDESGIGYGAVMALAVHVTNPPELGEHVAFDPLPSGLAPQWTPDEARRFLSAVRHFADESHFMVFFSDQQGLYDLAVNRMSIAMENQSVGPWTQAFFGMPLGAAFTVILGMSNGTSSYSSEVVASGRKGEYFSVVGVGQVDSAAMPVFSLDTLQPVMHEYLTAYIATRPSSAMERFASAGRELYPAVEPIMTGLGYNDWHLVVTETLVRAITIRWIGAGHEKDLVPRAVGYQQKMGFYWLDGMNDLLVEYESQRSQFPTFEAFVPRLAVYLATYAANADERIDAVEATWGNP